MVQNFINFSGIIIVIIIIRLMSQVGRCNSAESQCCCVVYNAGSTYYVIPVRRQSSDVMVFPVLRLRALCLT